MENRHNPLFLNNPGKVLPVASLKSSDVCLKHIAKQCEITKNLKFHMARYTFATTTQIYVKVTNQMIGNAISRIENQIGERSQFPTLMKESDS